MEYTNKLKSQPGKIGPLYGNYNKVQIPPEENSIIAWKLSKFISELGKIGPLNEN